MPEYAVRLKSERGLAQEFVVEADSDVAAVRHAIELSGLWKPELDSVLVVNPAPKVGTMLEYRVVIGLGQYGERPVQLLADTQEAAEQGALSLFRDAYPDAKVAIAGLVDRTPAPPAPTVGRIVHYQPMPQTENDRYLSWTTERDGQPWAAIITRVLPDGRVNLDLRKPIGMDDERLDPASPGIYPFAETPTPGHWNWPPRG